MEKANNQYFRWMVVVRTGILTGTALEVVLLHRRLIPSLAFTLFILANMGQWWVIHMLGTTGMSTS